MKNYKKMIKKIKMIIILAILLFFYTTICAFSYAKTTLNDIENSVLRLHVLANSDSKEDQELKYKVRDQLLKYMNNICDNVSTKEEAIQIANKNVDNFKKIAKQTIIENGYNYDVDVQIGNFEFPTKNYGNISFPAGFYDAVRVTIGEAKGQNWWCVMFPPLCFIDVTSGVVPEESKEILKENMNEEDYALVSKSDTKPEITFKFKVLELFAKSGFMTASTNK